MDEEERDRDRLIIMDPSVSILTEYMIKRFGKIRLRRLSQKEIEEYFPRQPQATSSLDTHNAPEASHKSLPGDPELPVTEPLPD